MVLFLFIVKHDSRFFPERFVVVVENLLLCVFEKAKDHSVLKEMRCLCACLNLTHSLLCACVNMCVRMFRIREKRFVVQKVERFVCC